MRDASCMTTTYHAMFDFDLVEETNLVDCGDCAVVLGRADRTFERAQADISQILAGGAMPVVLGGDHSVDDPGRERGPGARRRSGPGPDRHAPRHGAGRRRRDAQPLLPDLPRRRRRLRPAQDGADRHLRLAEPARRARLLPRARHHRDLAGGDLGARHGAGRSTGRSRWPTQGDGIYLSFDIDSLDAAHAVGTCCPTPGGLTSREAIELTRGVAAAGLIGVDVVEIGADARPDAGDGADGQPDRDGGDRVRERLRTGEGRRPRSPATRSPRSTRRRCCSTSTRSRRTSRGSTATCCRPASPIRPHGKAHKCPEIGRRQVAAGAVGVVRPVARRGRGVRPGGHRRRAAVERDRGHGQGARGWRRSPVRRRVAVCVDNPEQVAELAAATAEAGTTLGVLVEVVTGKRCGVDTPEEALRLADAIHAAAGLELRGLQAYMGSAQHLRAARRPARGDRPRRRERAEPDPRRARRPARDGCRHGHLPDRGRERLVDGDPAGLLRADGRRLRARTPSRRRSGRRCSCTAA